MESLANRFLERSYNMLGDSSLERALCELSFECCIHPSIRKLFKDIFKPPEFLPPCNREDDLELCISLLVEVCLREWCFAGFASSRFSIVGPPRPFAALLFDVIGLVDSICRVSYAMILRRSR